MISVTISKIRQEATDIRSYELLPLAEALPSYKAGAHIEVRLTDKMARCYSLCGRERDRYLIAVKREPKSSGGSQYLHDVVREGDSLTISAPRNQFPLHETAEPAILIGGGIGITPLLAMAYELSSAGRSFHMHYFARSVSAAAFRGLLKSGEFDAKCSLHFGLSPPAVNTRMMSCLAAAPRAAHVYVCGPGPFIDTAVALAKRARPDLTAHFERFTGTTPSPDAKALELILAKSNRKVTVPPDKSILEVLEAEGLEPAATCRQGFCGDCIVDVLDGELDHRDEILTEEEKMAGNKLCICVSRAKSKFLTIDL
jgi:vanillate monooxygenase ferredoxin subunit